MIDKTFGELTYADFVALMSKAKEPKGTVDDPVLWPVGPRVWDYFRKCGMGEDGKISSGVRLFIPKPMPTLDREGPTFLPFIQPVEEPGDVSANDWELRMERKCD